MLTYLKESSFKRFTDDTRLSFEEILNKIQSAEIKLGDQVK